MVNSAWNSLGQAEAACVRFVQAIEPLAVMHGNPEVGDKARSLAQQLHEFREVLTTWTQE
jgi:hypothetical protein